MDPPGPGSIQTDSLIPNLDQSNPPAPGSIAPGPGMTQVNPPAPGMDQFNPPPPGTGPPAPGSGQFNPPPPGAGPPPQGAGPPPPGTGPPAPGMGQFNPPPPGAGPPTPGMEQFNPPPPGAGPPAPEMRQFNPPPPGTNPPAPGMGQFNPPPPGTNPPAPGMGQFNPPPPGTNPPAPGMGQFNPPPPGTNPPAPGQFNPPPPGSYPSGVPMGQFNATAPGSNPLAPGAGHSQPPAPGTMPPNPSARGQHSKENMISSDDPIPSAPVLSGMDKIYGYENVSFNAVPAPPPAYHEPEETRVGDRGITSNLPTITEDQVREALTLHVAENCCFGTAAAKEMVFNSLEASSAFHYKLDSFTERRETAWAYEPYTGQVIDSSCNGRPPLPWDIQVIAPKPFVEGKAQLEIPHTALVRPCHACRAFGYRRCSSCTGCGHSECFSCNGSGWVGIDKDHTCIACDGRGHRTCMRCHGHGRIECCTCEAAGQLKCYICLTVTWVVHGDDYIVERTALPDKFIQSVSGQIAFEEEQPRVWPVRHFPDNSINKASSDIINKHNTCYQSERILTQRHQIRIIPVVQAFYQWNNKNGEFYVYGFEQKVYAPDYPQKWCCGCQIL